MAINTRNYWNLLTACYQSCLSVSFFLSLSLTCHINTLVCIILLWSNQMPLPTMLLLYWFWLTKICICHKPCPTRVEMRDQQIALPTTLMLLFFYASGTLHSRHICAIFELWGRPFCLSLLVSFFGCCYESNSIHTASLSHFISLVHLAHHLFFIQPWTVAEFRLHIQHATHCLFEWRTQVGLSEAVHY